MVLVDTSVWVKHFRQGKAGLAELLRDASVLTHPFVVGELACGAMHNRAQVIENLVLLPAVAAATHQEVLELIEKRRLWGRGICWVDAHLLASALLSYCPLWTLDNRLNAAAELVGVGRFG